MNEGAPHILNSGALLPTSIFFLRTIADWDTTHGFVWSHFFIHRKSLLPGCEAIHCGGVEPPCDLHTFFFFFWVCLVLHAQEAVSCYWIRAAFTCKLVIW